MIGGGVQYVQGGGQYLSQTSNVAAPGVTSYVAQRDLSRGRVLNTHSPGRINLHGGNAETV